MKQQPPGIEVQELSSEMELSEKDRQLIERLRQQHAKQQANPTVLDGEATLDTLRGRLD